MSCSFRGNIADINCMTDAAFVLLKRCPIYVQYSCIKFLDIGGFSISHFKWFLPKETCVRSIYHTTLVIPHHLFEVRDSSKNSSNDQTHQIPGMFLLLSQNQHRNHGCLLLATEITLSVIFYALFWNSTSAGLRNTRNPYVGHHCAHRCHSTVMC